MLAHAFASGARLVELLTDLRNAWSQAAIAKLGAIREGVLRRDRKTWTGHIRDTVVFSITDLDWPKVSQRLDMRLEGQKGRSEEHTSELQSLMRISYAVFCLKKKTNTHYNISYTHNKTS